MNTDFNFAPNNIEHFKRKLGIKSNEKLAEIIGYPVSTLKSYIANPNSNSRVKQALADLFGITVEALVKIDFASTEEQARKNYYLDKLSFNDVSSVDVETYDMVKSSLKFETLKDEIVEKYNLKVKSDLARFSIAVNSKDDESSLSTFSLMLFSYTDTELLKIDNDYLEKYIQLCISNRRKDYLNALAKRYVSFDTKSINRCLFIATLLEQDYEEISEYIYKALIA